MVEQVHLRAVVCVCVQEIPEGATFELKVEVLDITKVA